MKKSKEPKWVLVTWRDSGIYSEQGLSAGTKVCIIQSSGFLVHQDKDCIKIARDKMEEKDEWRGLIVIPRENIKKIIFLRYVFGPCGTRRNPYKEILQ